MTERFLTWGVSGTLALEDPSREIAAVERLWEWIAAFDRSCNRFRPDAEISTINRAGGGTFAVSPLLMRVLVTARRAWDRTEGLCDPTVLNALVALGYDRDYDELLSSPPAPVQVVHPAPGMSKVNLDANAGTVTIPPGVGLDVGATAKALLADVLADELSSFGGVLVEVGGDVALRGHGPDGPWVVGVANSLVTDGSEARVTLDHGGIATSSTATRTWLAGDRLVNHIIDPRTGDSANGPYSVATVAASSCVLANAFATATLLWGAEATWHIAQAGHSARLVRRDGECEYVGGWPIDQAATCT